QSPFFKRTYSEFEFTNTIYNFYIHPQWDAFGSPTLYLKVLFADYNYHFVIIELIGEWNDAIDNDIMFLKRDVIDPFIEKGISKFVLIGENVLNFHESDDCYYEEWYEDIRDQGGWIALINFREHVLNQMKNVRLQNYLIFGDQFNDVNWRVIKPFHFHHLIEGRMLPETA
ncbi:MAG: hypothetical protein LH473_10060, partial [Chitinophagales bacterium]|nr:hypothetical protein [Chitinophagales bacterium]